MLKPSNELPAVDLNGKLVLIIIQTFFFNDLNFMEILIFEFANYYKNL